jgi:hypothetical protein
MLYSEELYQRFRQLAMDLTDIIGKRKHPGSYDIDFNLAF